jgi:hypothetical protein
VTPRGYRNGGNASRWDALFSARQDAGPQPSNTGRDRQRRPRPVSPPASHQRARRALACLAMLVSDSCDVFLVRGFGGKPVEDWRGSIWASTGAGRWGHADATGHRRPCGAKGSRNLGDGARNRWSCGVRTSRRELLIAAFDLAPMISRTRPKPVIAGVWSAARLLHDQPSRLLKCPPSLSFYAKALGKCSRSSPSSAATAPDARPW